MLEAINVSLQYGGRVLFKEVNLKFNIKMGVFAINDEHILSGYAR